MHIINQLAPYVHRIFQGFAPREKPKALFLPLDFTNTGSNGADIPIDLGILKDEARLELVQSLFVNNRLSGVALSLTEIVTRHTVTVNAGSQAYLPFFSTNGMKFLASTAGTPATDIASIHLLNVAIPALVW